MPNRNSKKQSRKSSRKAKRSTKPKRGPKPRPMSKASRKKLGSKKTARGTAVSFSVASQKKLRPKMKTLRMGQKAGLTLNGGTIKGVVEITPSLQITSSGNNVPGNVLALIPLHAQTIAPGTRLSDIAGMYDQYVFDKIWFELDCATNYMENGTLLGFVEANATDIIANVNAQVGNITEWVDHGSAQIHPIAKGVLTFPKQGDYMKRISKGPKGGFYLNTVIATGGSGSLSVADCFQGQFCLMVHNKINTQGGQALSYPIDLGALRCHFTLRLREAAERNQEAGAADVHLTSSASSVTNPLAWTGLSTEQATMQIGSTLGFSSYFSAGAYVVSLPVGSYYIMLEVGYTTTGAAQWTWLPNGTQTGYTTIDSGASLVVLSSATQTQIAWVQCKVNTPGQFSIFHTNGTSTSYVASGYAKMIITAMPGGVSSLLKHKDLELRSLAWIQHQQNQDTTSDVLRVIRAELGLEAKRSTTEAKMQQVYTAILKERASSKEREAKRFAFEEKEEKKRDSDWEENDIEDTPRAKLWCRQQSDTVFERVPRLKIVQDDEKSDRGKTSREPPRASSLKS